MLKIGEFARLNQVSVVTLRHYDEVGLLAPVTVDLSTGYRFYSVGQIPRLNRILSLKDLGFTLEQIGTLLEDDLTLDQLRGMLTLRRAEVEQRLEAERERLTRIEARLRRIEQEDQMSTYEVILKTVSPLLVASRRISIPSNDQVPRYLDPAFEETFRYVTEQGGKSSGPCLALWYTSAATLTDEDAEAAVPLDRSLPGSERVQVYELPEVQVAAYVHHGDFSEFGQGHQAILTWIEHNGYVSDGPYREIYFQGDSHHPQGATTEIQYPVRRP